MESAQHHGVPTRLLDFTTNCLNALYFACQKSKDKNEKNGKDKNKENGKVFLFWMSKYLEKLKNEKRNKNIDNLMFGNYKTELNVEMPAPYTPFYHDFRLALQSSRFLIWGKNNNSLENQLKDFNEYFTSIIILSDNKEPILNNLDKIGINNKTVYPGLDSLGKYIKNNHSKSY